LANRTKVINQVIQRIIGVAWAVGVYATSTEDVNGVSPGEAAKVKEQRAAERTGGAAELHRRRGGRSAPKGLPS
jgi:hypothetical protein